MIINNLKRGLFSVLLPSKLQRNSSNSPTLLLFRLKDNYQNDPHQRVANTGTLRLHISTASER